MKKRRWLDPAAFEAIRGARAQGESVTELAEAYGISVSHCSKIARGLVHPARPVGAAAGAWKDYGPKCKRGHPRPAVRDAKARRCRKCAADRQRAYRSEPYRRLHAQLDAQLDRAMMEA